MSLHVSLLLAVGLLGGLWTAAAASEPPPPQLPPFYWLSTMPPGRSAPANPPLLPDLAVQWVERTPRYPRYCVDYSRGLPELCAGAEDDKHFPEPGEVVTFTAHIANVGGSASPPAAALWRVGQDAGLPQDLPALGPGVTTTLAITLPWPSAPLTITLDLDPPGALPEITRANNTRSDRSAALSLEVLAHPLVDAAFARRANLAGSWSFADWMQAQVAALNANLAASAYPSVPHGATDRVRIDRIVVTEDVGGDTVASELDFDGRWTFRVEPDDPDTTEDEAALSAEAYAAAFAGQIDWGLVHELTHQLGAIDLYQMNVASSYQNEVLDGDGRPLLLGFEWTRPDLMGGGDRGDYPWTSYSEHTARALQSNAGQRRGYFGEYLYDLPGQASLLALDNRGQPLPGAQVTAYQSEQGVVRSQAVWSGVTGIDGRFTVPARAVPFGGLTTATGHTLAPNPFGAIDVVGRNGQFLLRISRQGQETYTWWTLTDFNLARWQGVSNYQRTLATHLPPPGAPAPPAQLAGQVDGLAVTLNWPASASPHVVGYRVYRGQEPDFYPFSQVAATGVLSYTGQSERTARYAVTAIDDQGRESGFSPIYRAPRLVYPAAVVTDPVTGQRTMLDRHDGGLVTQLADERWVGRQGSVHLGLTGSQGLARNAQGQLLVAVTGEDRIKVIDPRWPAPDATHQVLNWFGRERFVDGVLAGPASVVQVGPDFSVAFKPQPDSATLGLADFDNTLELSDATPLLASGVTLALGRFDGGVRINGADRLEYDAAGRFDPNEGAVELWVRPEWVWDDDEEHVLLEVGASSSIDSAVRSGEWRLRLAKASWNGLYAWLSDGTREVVLYAGIEDWQPGQWRHVAVAWQPAQPGTTYRRYTLWSDGILRDSQVLRRPAAGWFERLAVGVGLDGSGQADATLDELRISDVARLGNSQEARLLVSQAAAGRVDVLDWLGARVSGLGGWQAPQGLAVQGNRVYVADPAGGAVHVLAFDGNELTRLATWRAELLAPHSLVALETSDRLLVSDQGDNQVKLLSGDGTVLRRWSGPNDGHSGSFRQPAGLAMLPNGDALVADAGNGRLVRIAGAAMEPRAYLPLLWRR